jgi:DNA-binding transcriptional LysR family regulator
VTVEDGFVDVLAAGCDAGIRYDERLEQDMIAVPIGPRTQRFATAASPAYLDRARPPRSSARSARPRLPRRAPRQRRDDDLGIRARRRDRAHRSVRTAVVRIGAAVICGRLGGGGERRHPCCSRIGCGPISTAARWSRCWSPGGSPFPGPFLYYPGRRYLPAPLRAFADFVRAQRSWE